MQLVGEITFPFAKDNVMPDKRRDGMACESLAVLVSSYLNGNTTYIIALVSKGMGGAIVEGVQDVCKMSLFFRFHWAVNFAQYSNIKSSLSYGHHLPQSRTM